MSRRARLARWVADRLPWRVVFFATARAYREVREQDNPMTQGISGKSTLMLHAHAWMNLEREGSVGADRFVELSKMMESMTR